MAKYKINIKCVETYNHAVVVEADSIDEAVGKVEKAWREDDYLYEETTDILDDMNVEFSGCGLASETDIKVFNEI